MILLSDDDDSYESEVQEYSESDEAPEWHEPDAFFYADGIENDASGEYDMTTDVYALIESKINQAKADNKAFTYVFCAEYNVPEYIVHAALDECVTNNKLQYVQERNLYKIYVK